MSTLTNWRQIFLLYIFEYCPKTPRFDFENHLTFSNLHVLLQGLIHILGRLTTFVREYPDRHLSRNTLPDLKTTCQPTYIVFRYRPMIYRLPLRSEYLSFPSCVQIINSSCSSIIVNMLHESF